MWNRKSLLFVIAFILLSTFGVCRISYATNINISADIGGTEDNNFDRDDIVYGAATLGLSPSTAYDLYVVYRQTWVDQMAIPARIAGAENSFTTNGSGDMAAGTLVWNISHTGGLCDIVIDEDGDGLYDATGDYVDTGVIAGMKVMSEAEMDGSFTENGEWWVNYTSINEDTPAGTGTYYWRELPSWKGYAGNVSFVMHDIWGSTTDEVCDYNRFCFTVNGVNLEVWVFENTDTVGDSGWIGPSGLGGTYGSLDDRGFLVRKNGDSGTDAIWLPGDPSPGEGGWDPDATVGTKDDYWGVFAQSGYNDSGYTTLHRTSPVTSNEVFEVAFFNAQLTQISEITCPSGVGGGCNPVSAGSDPKPCACANCNECLVVLFSDPEGTLISLLSFTAVSDSSGIILEWITESETDNAGFNLWRSQTEEGEYIKINDAMIPPEGGATTGHIYTYKDEDVETGVTYYYKLEDIDLRGLSTFHGPVSVEWDDCLELLSPEDGAQLSRKMRQRPAFAWENGVCTLQRIEFSSDPEFSKPLSFILDGNTESWKPRSKQWRKIRKLRRKWNKIRKLRRKGSSIYWHVVGLDDTGETVYSPVFSFTLVRNGKRN